MGIWDISVTLMRTFDKDEAGEHTSKRYEMRREGGKKTKEESQ